MAFKMKGNPMKRNFGLPGIDNNSEGNTDKPDGRSASSAFQQMDETTPGPPQMKVPTGAKDVSAPLMHKKKDSQTGEKVKHKHESKLKRILIGKKGRALADKLTKENPKKSPAKRVVETSIQRLMSNTSPDQLAKIKKLAEAKKKKKEATEKEKRTKGGTNYKPSFKDQIKRTSSPAKHRVNKKLHGNTLQGKYRAGDMSGDWIEGDHTHGGHPPSGITHSKKKIKKWKKKNPTTGVAPRAHGSGGSGGTILNITNVKTGKYNPKKDKTPEESKLGSKRYQGPRKRLYFEKGDRKL